MSSSLSGILKKPGLTLSIGVHDAFTAAIAEQAGFKLLFVGGFGVSASQLGLPDLNLLSMTEMADAVRRICSRVNVPVIADGDTGHGGFHNVQRTVREFEEAGAAGLILEDQVAPKRCGHFMGKAVVSRDEMLARIRAAVAARRSREFKIVARTDARDTDGLREALHRVTFCRKAGADIGFVESPHSEEELGRIARTLKRPLLVNMLTGGKTPNLSARTLERMGYTIAVYPIESLLVLGHAMRRLCDAILENGSVDQARGDMIGFSEVKSILGLEPMLAASRKVEGGAR